SGALLPGGGVGGYAIGGWLVHLTGAPTRWIVRRSSGLFFLTSGVNSAAVIGAGLLLVAGVAGPHDFARSALPMLLAGTATLVVLAVPRMARRRGTAPGWLEGIAVGIRDAERAGLHPHWRLVGALGYLGFDIAVLWVAFTAVGHAPPLPDLVLGYSIGYLANSLPVPGGIGVLDAGLSGALLLYGASPVHVVAAVLVYHAIAFWIPSLGGLIAYARLRPRLVVASDAATLSDRNSS
ncbi:MAG: lysylphosphatidylglycerol synthase domain-containing protein, partial [Actinomycetota bacterium]|nr:lysylphosphatidylglycerol synthase domain-containing protein [Actinomycetota bacterium]